MKQHPPPALNFDELPNIHFFDRRSMLITLDKDLERKLPAQPEVFERVRSAVMFAEQSGKQDDLWRSAAFLRAALAEFGSIDEVQPAKKWTPEGFDLGKTSNPLPHLLSLMRHLNIHVKAIQGEPHKVEFTIGEHAGEHEVFIVSNLDAADLAVLNNGKLYQRSDLQMVVAWFEEAQRHWGAGYLIRVGVEIYARALCEHYGL
jgi:hypothetical protein